MAYATAADVAVELGRPASSAAESDQWEAWLARVERSIERRFRRAGLTLDEQVELGDPTAEDVRDVEVAAVLRKIELNKREGRTSSTRSVDDAAVTDRWENDSVGLDLTPDDWDALLPGSEAGAFSTRPGFEPDDFSAAGSWA